jgi:hypothetical protein
MIVLHFPPSDSCPGFKSAVFSDKILLFVVHCSLSAQRLLPLWDLSAREEKTRHALITRLQKSCSLQGLGCMASGSGGRERHDDDRLAHPAERLLSTRDPV